jgi:hypothetical protein
VQGFGLLLNIAHASQVAFSSFCFSPLQVIRINMYYSTQPLPGPPETTPTFSNISIINITGAAVTVTHALPPTLTLFQSATGLNAGLIRCLPESPCDALFFQDVRIIDAVGAYKCDPTGLVTNSSFINCHPAPTCIELKHDVPT